MPVKQPLKNLAVGHFLNEPFIAACAPGAARHPPGVIARAGVRPSPPPPPPTPPG